ncbi:MAG: hypothetical protein JO041_06695 [Acidobacteria bacterium]|nr:hypothetical protein [Acidobacteriota bacterium]
MPILRRLRTRVRKSLPPWVVQAVRLVLWRRVVRLAGITNWAVAYGPFAGMKYASDTLLPSSGGGLQKLLGAYEIQCAQFVTMAIATGYSQVINIGAAEGYYAVGFALKLPGAEIVAFEADHQNRCLLEKQARLNGVRVQVEGLCTPGTLSERLKPAALLVVDCEGAELQLLDPAKVPELRSADILVEFHDYLNPELSGTILRRFEQTHRHEIVPQERPSAALYPLLSPLSPEDQACFLNEPRLPGMTWGFLRSNQARAEALHG